MKANGWMGKKSMVITHLLPLEEAARGYEMFDKKEANCEKVVLRT